MWAVFHPYMNVLNFCMHMLLCTHVTIKLKTTVTLWKNVWPMYSPQSSHFIILELTNNTSCHTLKFKVELFANLQNTDKSCWVEASASQEIISSYCLVLWCIWGKPISKGMPTGSLYADDPYKKLIWWSWMLQMGWPISAWRRSNC